MTNARISDVLLSCDCPVYDRYRKEDGFKDGKENEKHKLPKIDSIEALAQFGDTHDFTEFEDELDEVVEPVFERETAVTIHL